MESFFVSPSRQTRTGKQYHRKAKPIFTEIGYTVLIESCKCTDPHPYLYFSESAMCLSELPPNINPLTGLKTSFNPFAQVTVLAYFYQGHLLYSLHYSSLVYHCERRYSCLFGSFSPSLFNCLFLFVWCGTRQESYEFKEGKTRLSFLPKRQRVIDQAIIIRNNSTEFSKMDNNWFLIAKGQSQLSCRRQDL